MTQFDAGSPATGEWECASCGYVVAGTELLRPARCPECSAASEAFRFYSHDEEEEWEDDDYEAALEAYEDAFEEYEDELELYQEGLEVYEGDAEADEEEDSAADGG